MATATKVKQLTTKQLAKELRLSEFAVTFLEDGIGCGWLNCKDFYDVGRCKALLGYVEYEAGHLGLTPGRWRLTEKGRQIMARLKQSHPERTLKGSKQAAGGRATPMAKKRRKLTAVERRTLAGRFAIHLRSLMDAKGWEVGDLHEQLKRLEVKVEKPAIHAWLRGEALPKARDLEKLGNALGLKDYREVLPPPG